MERAAAELRQDLPPAAHDVIERRQGTPPDLDDGSEHCSGPSSASVRTVLRGWRGPMGASAVVCRSRHLATVLGFRPYGAARVWVDACAVWVGRIASNRLEHAASCGLSREDLLPKGVLLLTRERTTTLRDCTPSQAPTSAATLRTATVRPGEPDACGFQRGTGCA